MTKVGVLHENAIISGRFWRKLISLRSVLADFHDRVYIFIQLMYNKNDHLAKQSIFVRCLVSSLASTTPPPPPRPKAPFTYVVYVYSDMSLSKGHLGSRGKASKNNLKDTSFTFPVTNVTIFSIFCTHAQEGYCKVLEMNSTSIPYCLALLLFEN